MKADRPAPDQVRGYSAVGGEGLSYSLDEPTPPDIKESLSIGPVDVPPGDSYFTGQDAGPHFAKNVWPAKPAELESVWTEYFRAVDSLATDLARFQATHVAGYFRLCRARGAVPVRERPRTKAKLAARMLSILR